MRPMIPVLLLAGIVSSHAWSAEIHPATCRSPAKVVAPAALSPEFQAARYDADYPSLAYAGVAVANAAARLDERLLKREVKLAYREERGYLDSLLLALAIDPASQVLVYSKSSVQKSFISPATPRAIYFNDETYVAWVKGSDFIEIAAMDCERGPVFYVFDNRRNADIPFRRETVRCLSCHDSSAMLGGGVPTFLVSSIPVDSAGIIFRSAYPLVVTDATPLEQRWAGWYVTGAQGSQTHLGNLVVGTAEQFRQSDLHKSGNRETVAGLFDNQPYLTDKSDIAALLVLEHQVSVQNLLARAGFKSRAFLAGDSGDLSVERSWDELSPKLQGLFRRLLEPVVRGLLFADAAAFHDQIRSTSGFDAWLQSQGPRDSAGRSLRELDLNARLFRYPLSYLVYSEAFDGLPVSAREYIYSRLIQILTGTSDGPETIPLSIADRQAVFEILKATKPDFAAMAGG